MCYYWYFFSKPKTSQSTIQIAKNLVGHIILASKPKFFHAIALVVRLNKTLLMLILLINDDPTDQVDKCE